MRAQQLAYAGRLLGRTAQTVDDIAAITGLGTSTTFFRLFVEQFGMRPDEFRRG
jgi:AraC-like DNA-binding protein